ncbi:MAG TPA: SAM-dependent chlorinase/fluorinase [Vicinamibacterales bacterium]|nr:SAM-dependent chlorinase/fluorinase [Vicinamibacterales bacterium]
MSRPIIALLTDFGLRDHYVGSMKGAMLSICADAALVDITHDVPAHDVRAGSAVLAAAYLDFPPGTVFAVVVDPGVGSSRRGIAIEAGRYRFVGPDNGVFSAVLARTPPDRVVELTSADYAKPEISRTFEGRDRFAPAAAWLATGVPIERLGDAVAIGTLTKLVLAVPTITQADIAGEVVRVDRFGNLITNVDRRVFDALSGGRPMTVHAAGRAIPVVHTYADVPGGSLCSVFGSTHHLEIAVNTGSAAALLAIGAGARVVISPARD